MPKLLSAALLFFISSHALAYNFPVEVIEYMDNVRVVAHVDKNDISDEPSWTPFKSALPLPVDKALDAVDHEIKAHPEYMDVHLTSIELKQLPHHEKQWHYLVRVNYMDKKQVKHPHFFAVLMNGKVISAIREPESIK